LAGAHVRNYPDFLREDNHMAKQPVRVVQIIARMNVGGPAVIVADLMRSLDKSAVEQTLITGYCDENEADYLETVATDVKATRIAGLGRSVSLVADVRAFFALVGMLRELRPDIVHTHTAKAGVLGRLASMLAGRKVKRVHTFHGHLLHGYFTGWKVRLVIAIEKFLAKRTDVLLAVGNKVKDDLLAVGIGKTDQYKVFFPGLKDPKKFEKAKVRADFEMEDGLTYIAFVGRLTQIKRPDRLLDVASEIKSRGLKARIVVAGEGDLFEKSKARASEQGLPITFLGWRKDISALFSASDIAILTSDNEGIPLTLIQAAQASLPIVATGVGSVSDIVVHEVNGYLVDSEPAALADALQKLAIDPVLREIMGTAGRERAVRYFSLEKMCADHTDLYQMLHR
jgi:glycosyltransferase involved in cell wall biosynthesis